MLCENIAFDMSKRTSFGDKTDSGRPENGSGDVPAAPLSDDDEAPKKQKLSMSFAKRGEFKLLERPVTAPVKKGIQIRLGSQKAVQPTNTVKPQSQSVAAMFNVDDDDEPEEMPPEARMRMRNIGRRVQLPPLAPQSRIHPWLQRKATSVQGVEDFDDGETPTSAGPNSFGKTKQGFCDAKKMFEKNMKKGMDSAGKAAAKAASTSPPSPQPEPQTPPEEAEAADE
ncbi:PEST proteolytic signal-containing nuclear protein-like isoform X1 [Bacillus rossius redtenbacheri]|uniref:PEST proteolytic signal-containing nuclear protein-like isoform X1 n=1 Tax=Bacillus rossius redtenbacheri TaxID=93214 RepID=UPI002FDCABBE